LSTLLILLTLTGCAALQEFWDKEFVQVYAPEASRDQKIRDLGNIFNYWLGRSKEERIRVIGPPDQCTTPNAGQETCEWSSRGASAGQRLTYSYDQGIATAWAYHGPYGQFTSANYQMKPSKAASSQTASPSSTDWSHPTKPKSEFSQDYYQCESDIVRNPKIHIADKFILQDAVFGCVKQKGWVPRR
jgi:hypothetical protein